MGDISEYYFEQEIEDMAKRDAEVQGYSVDKIDEYATVVFRCLMYHDCHRPEAIQKLFPNASQDYKREWLKRDTLFKFFAHLDDGNRARFVRLAMEYYGEE
jgi:hypothetical protein